MTLRLALRRLGAITSVPTPTPPPGTGVVFHSRMAPVRYSVSTSKWLLIVSAAFFGVMSGNQFYRKCIMRPNPPNPPRDPNEKPPERHPHSVAEEE